MKYNFPKDFTWGVATAAAQIEGGYLSGGKGLSIWDAFAHIPGNIANNDNLDIACDSYHRFSDDLKLLKDLGVNSYRYSISWSRIYPTGKGTLNQKGMDYYKNITDSLLESGIQPNITLYHWDLPYELERLGGWRNRDCANWFADYASTIFSAIGDRVPMFTTLNEPIAVFAGYAWKFFAPGYGLEKYGREACHNLFRAHGKAVQSFRAENLKNSKIGVVVDMWNSMPLDATSEADMQLARHENENAYRYYINALLKGKYSEYMLEQMQRTGTLPDIYEGDMEEMSPPLDFWGLNVYNRYVVSAKKGRVGVEELKQRGGNFLDDAEEYYPQAVYDCVKILREDFGLKLPIYITENGTFVFDEKVENGQIVDEKRIQYVKGFLQQIARANAEGLDIQGYYLWSLLDNFEWGLGYTRKYGLCRVDPITQDRTPKKSYHFYADVIKNNGLD